MDTGTCACRALRVQHWHMLQHLLGPFRATRRLTQQLSIKLHTCDSSYALSARGHAAISGAHHHSTSTVSARGRFLCVKGANHFSMLPTRGSKESKRAGQVGR